MVLVSGACMYGHVIICSGPGKNLGRTLGNLTGPDQPMKAEMDFLMVSRLGIAIQLTSSSTLCGRDWKHVQNHCVICGTIQAGFAH